MAESTSGGRASTPGDGAPRRSGKRGLLFGALAFSTFVVGAGAALFLLPDQRAQVLAMVGMAPEVKPVGEAKPAPPRYVELNEMTVTMADAARSRQLRIKIAVQMAAMEAMKSDAVASEISSPRVYDALVLYLRTLKDTDVEGAIAVDRIRGDVFRRLELLLGQDVVRDVLITALVIA